MRGLLALLVLWVCRPTAAVSDRDAVLLDISKSMCEVNLFTRLHLFFRYCAQDGIPSSSMRLLCDWEFFLPTNLGDRLDLRCDATCPNQTASDVVWNIHIMSFNYDITLSCRNNNCTSKNEFTRFLQLEQEFTTDSNNTLQLYFSQYFHDSLMGCVVTAGDCVNATYWTIHGVEPKDAADRITDPVNNQVYRVALGESLFAMCEAHGDGNNRNVLFWHKGQSTVTQFSGHCYDLDINNRSCIAPQYEEYRRTRVKSYKIRIGECSSLNFQRSYLDISIANWTDNGSYSCVSSILSNTYNVSSILSNTYYNVSTHIIVDVLPEFLEQPNSSHIVSNTTNSSHSCVAKAGWGARLQWINSSGDVIPEHSPNDTNLPPFYVTYSITNVSTVLSVNNPNYTVSPINSVYPVHNAMLHYHGQNRTFTCVITGVNTEFLQQYDVANDNLRYSITVHTKPSSSSPTPYSSSSSLSNLTAGSIIGIVIGAVLSLIISVLILFFCYAKYRRQSKHKTLSVQSPFRQITAESAIDSRFISEKAQFPREKITLLHVLGEGHFGIVWKAKAEGIVQNAPNRNIVAIKTTKDDVNATNDLWSELDILLKIEPHPNICNILGYCDDKVKSLYIILEYCMLGKLKDYLRSCDSALVGLGLPVELRNYQNSSSQEKGSSCSTDYVNIMRSTTSSSSYARLLRKASVGSMQSDSVFYDGSIAYAPESMDSDYSSLNYAESLMTLSRDYANSPGVLYNEDIANFALQIAYGLQHLEKLKIYHGDLSARNILIAEGFVLKIADFGQARELNNQDYYRRQTERDLPVKWMAIESLRVESLCTHKSDIWSYGVVLWEIATYGQSPYEDVPIADMLQHLEEGHRLSFPNGCTDAWYKLMLRCWSEDSEIRPSASEVTELLAKPPFYDPTAATTQLMTAV